MDPERLEQILAALDAETSKAAVCRAFQMPRSTFLGTLERVGWTGARGRAARPAKASTRKAAAG